MTQTYTSRFSPHLHLVQQYAFVSANSRMKGDEIVKATLGQLSDTVRYLPSVFDSKTELLRRAHIAFEEAMETAGQEDETAAEWLGGCAFSLPNPARQAAFLKEVAELTDEQIGLVLGMNVGAVRAFLKFVDDFGWARSRVRALIVEDDIWIAHDLREILERDGHEVVGIATTKDAALALAKESNPDLLVCDVRLEDGSSGIDFVIETQAFRSLPTLFVTAFPEKVRELRPMSCTSVISKPFSEEQVRAEVANAIGDIYAA
ncbi:MAG: response regulator [Henriciella sp.]|uniref:response regulator n=1 Tax=Henriciella sp. TaxID=1968823 RepID=UPI003C7110C9